MLTANCHMLNTNCASQPLDHIDGIMSHARVTSYELVMYLLLAIMNSIPYISVLYAVY